MSLLNSPEKYDMHMPPYLHAHNQVQYAQAMINAIVMHRSRSRHVLLP
jgi:hypothetical protein